MKRSDIARLGAGFLLGIIFWAGFGLLIAAFG